MVEREDVLKVEFTKINNEWSVGIIAYQNIDILERNDFEDEELKIKSCHNPYYSYDSEIFYIKGYEEKYDNIPFHIKNKDIENLKERIKALNDKYGIKKRWRAEEGKLYYSLHIDLGIYYETDGYTSLDNKRYKTGNYFKTREEAEAKRDKIFKVLEEE